MNIIPVSQNKSNVSIANFTKDQLSAYEELLNFIQTEYTEGDYKRALSGPAGTGKTYLIRALIKNSGLSYSVIGLAAPTHKACRVLQESINIPGVKGTTLASDLGLRPNYSLENFDVDNPPFDSRGKIKVGNYKIYIVDESSMINKSLMILLERSCKANKVKIIYIGDSYQLPPPEEKYSSAFKGVKTCYLKQIVRQDDDNPVRNLLSMLRKDIDHSIFHFLEYISKNRSAFDDNYIKGYQVCTDDEFLENVITNFSNPQLTKDVDFVKVIGYTNDCVSNWNKFIRENTIKDAEKSVITKNDLILSYTTVVNAFNEIVIANSEDYIIQDIVNYTHPDYELNGFLVKFIQIFGGKVTSPLFIIDHRDMNTLYKYVEIYRNLLNTAKSASLSTRSQKWKEYFAFRDSCLLLINIKSSNGSLLARRTLDYGFALTAHKSQGSTFDTVLVDVKDIVFDKYGRLRGDADEINRTLYVACSRCKNKLYLKF